MQCVYSHLAFNKTRGNRVAINVHCLHKWQLPGTKAAHKHVRRVFPNVSMPRYNPRHSLCALVSCGVGGTSCSGVQLRRQHALTRAATASDVHARRPVVPHAAAHIAPWTQQLQGCHLQVFVCVNGTFDSSVHACMHACNEWMDGRGLACKLNLQSLGLCIVSSAVLACATTNSIY